MRSPGQHVFYVFKKGKSYFLIPFWMLTATLDRLGPAPLAVYGDKTIWILFANMSFIRKMVSPEDDDNESANFTRR